MKHSVVSRVVTDVALVEVNVVNAMKAIGVPKLDINRLMKVLFKLCAERVYLSAGVLTLIEVQRQ